ncbi:hypothetical protein GCM10020219_094190 [Nonomuraea dietziae]
MLTASADHPQLPYLAEAGIEVEVVTATDHAALYGRRSTTPWSGWPQRTKASCGRSATRALALDDPPVIEVVPGSYDLPGARACSTWSR